MEERVVEDWAACDMELGCEFAVSRVSTDEVVFESWDKTSKVVELARVGEGARVGDVLSTVVLGES